MPLTRERDTQQRPYPAQRRYLPVKGSTTIMKGALVVLQAGYAIPGTEATALVAVGCAAETVTSGTANGSAMVAVDRGVWGYAIKADDAVTVADVGKTVFVVDDQTIGKTSATDTRSPAGTLYALEGTVAWVEFA